LISPVHILSNPVDATRINAELTVRMNLIIIEMKDTVPPDMPIPPTDMTIFLSIKGLTIPTAIAKGETAMTLYAILLNGIPPKDIITTGYSASGSIEDIRYLLKDTVMIINNNATSVFVLGSSL
jgi:hypothetical protein